MHGMCMNKERTLERFFLRFAFLFVSFWIISAINKRGKRQKSFCHSNWWFFIGCDVTANLSIIHAWEWVCGEKEEEEEICMTTWQAHTIWLRDVVCFASDSIACRFHSAHRCPFPALFSLNVPVVCQRAITSSQLGNLKGAQFNFLAVLTAFFLCKILQFLNSLLFLHFKHTSSATVCARFAVPACSPVWVTSI